MCLIVFNPHGHKLPEDRMRVAFRNNGDGYGLMWHEEGRVKFIKEHDVGVEAFLDRLKEFEGRSYALHLRWRTHGSLGIEQCHPHVILSKDLGDGSDFVMMHNGVFHGLPNHPVKSDTMILAERLREELLTNGVNFKSAIKKFEKVVSNNNRVLFLNSQGKAIFLNAGLGFWDNGVWYSNTYSFHGLERVVKPVTHYVYSDGKLIPRSSTGNGNGTAPSVDALPKRLVPLEPTKKSSNNDDNKVIWPPSSSKLARQNRKTSKVPVLRGTGTIPPYEEVQKIVLAARKNKKEKKRARKLERKMAKQEREGKMVRIFTQETVSAASGTKVRPVVSSEYPPTEAKLLSRLNK